MCSILFASGNTSGMENLKKIILLLAEFEPKFQSNLD